MSEQESTPYPEYSDLDITELATAMKEIRKELDASAAITSNFQKRFDYLRKNIIPLKLEDAGMTSVRLTGVGTLSLHPDAYTQTLDSPALMQWLEEQGLGDLIKDTVNPSTLKSFAKSRIKDGLPLPPDEIFKFTPYQAARITK